MNLQEKTIAVLVASLISVIIIITVFVSVILISSYTTLETSYMEKDLTLEHSELADETGKTFDPGNRMGALGRHLCFCHG